MYSMVENKYIKEISSLRIVLAESGQKFSLMSCLKEAKKKMSSTGPKSGMSPTPQCIHRGLQSPI